MNKRFWKRIKRNWQVKLYMFLLAVILWFFVVTNQVYETGLDVPLDIIELKPSKILVSDVPKVVSVRFSGRGKDLLILKYFQQPRMEVDVHTINYFYDYPLQTEFIVIPPGIDAQPLYIIGPDTVNIRLEDELVQRLPIYPRVEVRPEAGYLVSHPVTTNPDSVTVVGPQSLVRRLRSIDSEERIFVGLRESTEQMVPLVVPDKRIRLNPTQVQASVKIDKIGERLLARVPIQVLQAPLGRSVILEPSVVDLRVQGPTERLAQLTMDSVMVTLNLARWRPEIRDYQPTVSLPDGIEMMNLNPDLVRVRLERSEEF